MERIMITRHALKSAAANAGDIAKRHRALLHGERKLQRTRHRLKTGDTLWAISAYPHDQVFLEHPPRDLPRSLSTFVDGSSKDLGEYLLTATRKESRLTSGQRHPASTMKPRRIFQAKEYNRSQMAYLARLIPKSAKLRAAGLMDMLYTAEELASELNMDQQIVRNLLIPEGMPYTQDENGRIFLHGPQIQSWISRLRTAAPHLGPKEVYCLGCRKVVPLVKPRAVRKGSQVLLKAKCPTCGAKVNRGVKAR
jgi:hypothetical protein